MTNRTKNKEIFTMRFAVKDATKEPHILDDMNDWIINKIESGVEQKEENEHDLQVVLSEAVVGLGQSIIPVPDIKDIFSQEEYHNLFNNNRENLTHSTSNIQFSKTVEDMIKGGQYFMDEKDIDFIKIFNNDYDNDNDKLTEDKFEDIMDQIESIVDQKCSRLDLNSFNTLETTEVLKMLSKEVYQTSTYIVPIIEHWKARRSDRDGKPIMPQLQYQDTTKKRISPYVCFRQCELPASRLRITRKSQQQAYNNLRNVRSHMEQSRTLIDMILRREKYHKQQLVLEHQYFEKLCEMQEYESTLGINDEDAFQPVSNNKRHKIAIDDDVTTINGLSSLTADKNPSVLLQQNDVEKYTAEFKPTKNNEKDEVYEDVTHHSYQPSPMKLSSLFFQTVFSSNNDNRNTSNIPQFRKRSGRGGRVFIDRNTRRHGIYLSTCDQFESGSDRTQAVNDLIKLEEMDDMTLHQRAQLSSTNDIWECDPLSPQQRAKRTRLSTTTIATGVSSSSIEASLNNQENDKNTIPAAKSSKKENSNKPKFPTQEASAENLITKEIDTITAVTKSTQSRTPFQTYGENNNNNELLA